MPSYAPVGKPFEQLTHGLRNTYVYWRCRCEACTIANRNWMRPYMRERQRRRRLNPRENAKHGTISGYNNDGCRCDLCRRARTEYGARRRAAQRAAVAA